MAQFPETRWSLVAASAGADSERSRIALEELCGDYWRPLYAFARRQGRSDDAAEDATQAFFADLLGRRALDVASADRGRFRSFLLKSFKNFLTNEWKRSSTARRSPTEPLISMDHEDGSVLEVAGPESDNPEQIYEYQWALVVHERALKRLAIEEAAGGRERQFQALSGYLTGDESAVPYRDVAEELGVQENAVKVAVHRLRQRFGRALLAEVAETVLDPLEVETEARHLLTILGDPPA